MTSGGWPLVEVAARLLEGDERNAVLGDLQEASETAWASTVLCYAPCLFCLTRYRVDSLSRYCLLLFILPAIWGVRRGLRISTIRLSGAVVVALGVTVLMIPAWSGGHPHWWTIDWALSLPAWYLVATSWKSARAGAPA